MLRDLDFLFNVTVVIMNTALKLFIGWLIWIICNYIGFPEWGTIVLMIMAVQSTYIEYNGV